MISVIVPIYNVQKFLVPCLQSIISQTYKDIEIILVDDGSTDDSGQIADSFAVQDARIKVYHKANGGLSSARNYGLEKSSGQYVCFIDSDDYIDENHISILYEKASISQADVIIGWYTLIDSRIGRTYVPCNPFAYKDINRNNIIEELLLNDINMPVWKNLYNLDFIKKNGISFISERKVYAEDDLFNLQVYSLANHIECVNNNSYYHLMLKGTLSQRYRDGFYKMQKNRYMLKCNFIENEVPAYIVNLESSLPNMIAYSLYKESLCTFNKAINNVKSISSDELFSKCVSLNWSPSNKYAFLYKCSKKGYYRIVVLLSKLFSSLEFVYRRLNYLKSK